MVSFRRPRRSPRALPVGTPTVPGSWVPSNEHLDKYVEALRAESAHKPKPLSPEIAAFKHLVENTPALAAQMTMAFTQARVLKKRTTPLGTAAVRNFDEFCALLNVMMTTAPVFATESKWNLEPAGLVGFPINALLNWPMATDAGTSVFANSLVNAAFKRILEAWSKWLLTEESRYVLTSVRDGPVSSDLAPHAIAWLSDPAKGQMVEVAFNWMGDSRPSPLPAFEDLFDCKAKDEYLGFRSSDDFFTRSFNEKWRPLDGPSGHQPFGAPGRYSRDESVVVQACESAPLVISTGVEANASFWLKGQPYSLNDMLYYDDLAPHFYGGTVYQAFLSALSYHKWNSPVTGTIKKVFQVAGTYYLQNQAAGFQRAFTKQQASFMSEDGILGDPVVPNDSQKFLTAVATRAGVFIEADDKNIGLMCFMAVGMAEVSSCLFDAKIKEGCRIKAGESLGAFHFGGSTHVLIFRPEFTTDDKGAKKKTGPKLEWADFRSCYNTGIGIDATNIPVKAQIAKAS